MRKREGTGANAVDTQLYYYRRPLVAGTQVDGYIRQVLVDMTSGMTHSVYLLMTAQTTTRFSMYCSVKTTTSSFLLLFTI